MTLHEQAKKILDYSGAMSIRFFLKKLAIMNWDSLHTPKKTSKLMLLNASYFTIPFSTK